MFKLNARVPSEDEILGCWKIVSCKLSDGNYPLVEGVKFKLDEAGDLIWMQPATFEQETDLPFFSCETFVFDSSEGELICFGNYVDRIALKCVLESDQLVLCYDKHLKLCCETVDQDQGLENLSCHPYTLIPALDEGFFTDITFVSSSGRKFPAHKTILSCFFSDVLAWDKIPPFLSNLSSDVLQSLLHYCYNCSLPSNISEDTAKELLRISQQHSNSLGNLGELCTEFLDATAVKNRIKSLMSELCNILEHILQMTESVAAAFPYNRDHSTIVDLTKMAQRQLAIGALKVVLICDIFTKHKADLSRDERQEIIQSCRKRLPYFVELVEKFLVVFQTALSGLTDSDKQEIAAYLTPEIEKMWFISTQLGDKAQASLDTITQREDKNHKKKMHLPKMATSLSRTLRNAVHLREVLTLKRFHQKVSSTLMFLSQKQFDFTSLSEEQKQRCVMKSMDKMLVEIPQQVRTLHKFPRIFEKKMPWREWKHSFKVWTSIVSMALRKMVTNRDILEPVVIESSNLVHKEEFGLLVQELGFLKVTSGQEDAQSSTPIKRSCARVESLVTCPPGNKSLLARSVMQLLVSGDHADMKFELNKVDKTHCPTCAKYETNKVEIRAHRVIVAARCSWFKRALLSGMKEAIERRILLPDTSPCLFYKFLEYLYSGILDTRSVSMDEVPEMLALSDKYEVDSLKESCEAILIKDIDDETVLIYLGIAEQFTVKRLKEGCLRYVTTHPDVMDSDVFEELPDNLKQEIADKVHQSMPRVQPFSEKVRQAYTVTNYEKLFENHTLSYGSDEDDVMPTGSSQGDYFGRRVLNGSRHRVTDDSSDDGDDDDDVLPAGNSQVERCIEILKGVLGDTVPRRELVRVTVAADCDPNRALNFYFS